MKSSEKEILPILGTSMGGGFYSGRINIDGQMYALIDAGKAGEVDMPWNDSFKAVSGAESYFDGLANTIAMAAAGSKLAQAAIDCRIGGNDDWYLPSMDEREIQYRNLKPGTEKNWLYARSGINLSSVPPTYPYTADSPAQTLTEAYQEGGAEAFALEYFWTSTQHAADSGSAWGQSFYYGGQSSYHESTKLRARFVRRLPI